MNILHEFADEVESDEIDSHSSHEYEQQAGIPIFVELKETVYFRAVGHACDHQSTAKNSPDYVEHYFGNKRMLLVEKDQE